MGIWSGIKYALNSTLGTTGFKSLDKLIKDVMINNYVTEEKTSPTTIGSEIMAYTTPKLVASFKIPSDAINMGSLTVYFPFTVYSASYNGYVGLTVNKTISTSATTTSSAFIDNVDFSKSFVQPTNSTFDVNITATNVKVNDTVYLYILGETTTRWAKVSADSIVKFTYDAIKEYTFKPITGYVKSIQSGKLNTSSRNSSTFQVRISPVNIEKSVVIVDSMERSKFSDTNTSYSLEGCGYLSSNNTLDINCTSYYSTYDFKCRWQVIEFY